MSKTKKIILDGIEVEGSCKYKADWLLNDFVDDTWYLEEYLTGQEQSRMVVNWNAIAHDGEMGGWIYWCNYGKKVAFWIMESPNTDCSTTGSLSLYCREIRAICEWFCFVRKCINIQSVTNIDINAYEEYLKSLNIRVNTIITRLLLIRNFYVLKDNVNDGLRFDPYLVSGSLTLTAKKIGSSGTHTPTIYPRELFYLINFSLDQLKRVDEIVERLDLYMSLRKTHVEASSAYKRRTNHSYKELYRECNILYGSSLIIIFSLLGERKHELGETTEKSVISMFETRTQEIIGREFKTAKNKAGKETVRPVINEVKKAFDAIERLTRFTRGNYEGSAFFLRLPLTRNANSYKSSIRKKELVTNLIYRMLNEVADKAGYEGKLRPHMFRRSFSMLWAWRYEVGDLYQLSKLLQHNNELFTKNYTEDEDVWQFLPESYQDLAFELIEQSLIGKRNLVGGFSTALKRYARLLRGKVSVLTPNRASIFARTLIERTNVTVIPSADGYCFMNTARGARARCSTDGQVPNYANRSESTCAKCPNFAADETRSEYWKKRYDAHKAVFESTNIDLVKNAAIKGMDVSSRYISKIPFKEIIDEC